MRVGQQLLRNEDNQSRRAPRFEIISLFPSQAYSLYKMGQKLMNFPTQGNKISNVEWFKKKT